MTATTQALQKGLDSARSSLAGFGKSVMSLKGLIAGSFAGAGIAALGHFASLADDLSDNIERLEVMFGSASASIVSQAERMNAAFGTSEITFTAMATRMGGLFKSLGVAEKPAAQMTNQLLVLGQAIANFKGISLEQAMGKVQAGMAGKGKALKELGINVKATMSVQERFNAIMSGGASIIGAMDQRAMDAGNAWTEFRGRIEQVEIELGKNLPEMIEPLFQELNTALVAAIEWFKSLKGETLDWGESTLQATKSAAEGMGWLQQSIGFVANAWQLAKSGFHAFRAAITEGLALILDGLGWVGKKITWLLDKLHIGTGDTGTQEFIDNWAEGMHDAAGKEIDDLHAEWKKPWASEGINAAFDAARKKIQEARKEVTKSALGAAGVNAPKVGKAAKVATEALTVGSKEAASAITRSMFQLGDDKTMKKVAVNSDKTVNLLQGIKDTLEAGNGEADMMDDF
jgi:hypothetical protein